MAQEIDITVYVRENCHLCEDVLATIDEVTESTDYRVSVTTIDVDEDSALRDQYGDRVPYVFVDGDPKFKYRIDAAELEDILTGPSG